MAPDNDGKLRLEDLGLIGNCQYSALVHNNGEIVWCCLPRFDSEPVFSTLLGRKDGGRFRIGPAGGEPGMQKQLLSANPIRMALLPSSSLPAGRDL